MDVDMLRNRMPEKIRKRLRKRQYNPGEPIILAGYDNNYVFFLIEGEAEATIQSKEDFLTSVYSYRASCIIGELEPFYNGPKPVSIMATTVCIAEILYKNDFLEWLQSDFEATKLIIRIIAQKLVANGLLIEEMSLLSVRERVLRCIASYSYKGELSSLTKMQISIVANTPIRSVNRAIAELTKQNLIYYQDKQFHIANLAAVMEYLPNLLK